MKAPISKQLAYNLIIPCIALTAVGLYDLFIQRQKSFYQDMVVVITFGIPALLLAGLLLRKQTKFKNNAKVRKANRWLKLPFPSFFAQITFIPSSLFLIAGLSIVLDGLTDGFFMLLLSVSVMILMAIAIDHPKIWFSDTLNMDDMLEDFKNHPQKNSPMYEDGVFSYTQDAFSIRLHNHITTIKWNEIQRITAYKMDHYTVDCIVIEIDYAYTRFTINDQTPGYMKFMDTAANHLHNFKNDWFFAVAFPAFETNHTIVYEKQKDEIEKETLPDS